jgi:hypothetical protein
MSPIYISLPIKHCIVASRKDQDILAGPAVYPPPHSMDNQVISHTALHRESRWMHHACTDQATDAGFVLPNREISRLHEGGFGSHCHCRMDAAALHSIREYVHSN